MYYYVFELHMTLFSEVKRNGTVDQEPLTALLHVSLYYYIMTVTSVLTPLRQTLL